jgi:serine/threonine protein kinase
MDMVSSSPETVDSPEFVLVIRDIYLVKKWLGKGKFGVVYQAVDITDDQLVAIKVEKADAEYSSIKHEVRIMNYLFQHKFRELPKIHWYGVQSGLTYLVMCYYEQCLESLEGILHRPYTPMYPYFKIHTRHFCHSSRH